VTRTETTAFPKRLGILGFVEEVQDGKRVATDRPKDYSLEFVGNVSATRRSPRPTGYLIPAEYSAAIEGLGERRAARFQSRV
jgi:hypothetical protein